MSGEAETQILTLGGKGTSREGVRVEKDMKIWILGALASLMTGLVGLGLGVWMTFMWNDLHSLKESHSTLDKAVAIDHQAQAALDSRLGRMEVMLEEIRKEVKK